MLTRVEWVIVAAVPLPVLVQQRLNRLHSRAVVLAAAEMARGIMREVADRYLDADLFRGHENNRVARPKALLVMTNVFAPVDVSMLHFLDEGPNMVWGSVSR